MNNPKHVWWKVGKTPYGTINSTDKSSNFEYALDLSDAANNPTYRKSVEHRVKELYEEHSRPLSIGISGKDGEIILQSAIDLGIPCEISFLHIKDVNSAYIDELINPLIKRHSLQNAVNIVEIDANTATETAINNFQKYWLLKPTYLLLPYLFENISDDKLIVIGEGDMEKTMRSYEISDQSSVLPFAYSEVSYRIWAEENQRAGEFYFHSSTPDLIKSIVSDPRFVCDVGGWNAKAIIAEEYPELIATSIGKTYNWERDWSVHRNIMNTLRDTAPDWWNNNYTCYIDIEDLK